MPNKYTPVPDLKLVFIRHAEKPAKGDNLSASGFNRSIKLSSVLYQKFGVPGRLLVPAVDLGYSTTTARMYQTITPFAIKYNLPINTKFTVEDKKRTAKYLRKRKGTVILIWEHNMIPKIVKSLKVKGKLEWPDDDYDSIWVVTFTDGQAVLTRDKQGIKPSALCDF